MKNFSWKLILVFAVIVAAIIYVLPTVEPDLWPHKQINLGLDLQGGMHLVLEVDTAKAVDGQVERIMQEIRDQLRKERLRGVILDRIEGNKIAAAIQDPQIAEKFRAIIKDEFDPLKSEQTITGGTTNIILQLPTDEAENVEKMAVDQALETIRNRIDQFGVAEPDIRRQGQRRILIQLPGIKDADRAKDLIGRTALLEFKLVDDTQDARTLEKGTVPPGRQILYRVETDAEGGQVSKVPFLLKKRTLLTGANLTNARVDFDQFNVPFVSINFDKKGARDFERITGENVNKRLAIVLDDTVASAPVIQEKIAGGQARITGNFTLEEAKDLAIVLRAGALPAPVNILEERTVGPSLGADSIREGLISMLIGGVLVVLFMIVYYKAAGVIADVALILNLVLIAAGLAAAGATLTLPGIAGIILTIGMAVDANVIIFERIREELALGRTPRAAIDAGFNRATLTILDANVTTLIAAIVLFQFGTGPVKGFAVTLSLGVIASMFTALVLSRLIFDYILAGHKVKTLSI
ncbi:MAG: protein translocase subunit SecD [Desulfobacterales bacterium]